MSPDDPRHGTDRGHSAHLRAGQKPCEACREAHRRDNILRQLDPNPRMVPSLGSQRRVNALQALGWGRQVIAHRLGYSDGGALSYLMKSETMYARTAAKIRAVYDELSMSVPQGPGPDRSRTWARKHGHLPPLAWDDGRIDDPDYAPVMRPARKHRDDVDEAVVLRVLSGERLDTTPAERAEVLRRWLASGRSERQLCRITGWRGGRYSDREDVAS